MPLVAAPRLQKSVLALDARCTLGEGIVWCPRRQALLWTDIEGRRLWRHDPVTGASASWSLPDRAGSFALCASGRVLLGLAKGLAFADIDAHDTDDVVRVEPVAAVEADNPRTRVNDGRTDRAGRFVFGTMNEDHETTGDASGHFYQFSLEHGLRPLTVPPVVIANSLCFSPDGDTIYFADTPAGAIMTGSYDSDAARVSNVREFARLGDGQGYPDGSIVDADGCVWNAAWAAGRIRQFSPSGELLCEVTVVAPNTTCPVFGGPDLRDLYVTSSRLEMNAEALLRVPCAGGLFRAEPGCGGLVDRLFDDR